MKKKMEHSMILVVISVLLAFDDKAVDVYQF
jgi:hypothetical protein